jgi:hypothetical protein
MVQLKEAKTAILNARNYDGVFRAPICHMKLNQKEFLSFQPNVHRVFSRYFFVSLMAHDIGELECTRRAATEGEPYFWKDSRPASKHLSASYLLNQETVPLASGQLISHLFHKCGWLERVLKLRIH